MDSKARIHPGIILLEQFLSPLGLDLPDVAESMGLEEEELVRLSRGERDIDVGLALRLGLYFGVPALWWLQMQACYDVDDAKLVQRLKEAVVPYPKRDEIMVTQRGARKLRPSSPSKAEPERLKVSQTLIERLRAQASLEEPRPERRVEVVMYKDGTPVLTGSER